MRVKDRLMELLRNGDMESLGALVTENGRTLRPLFGRLWDPDQEVRDRAAVALGLGVAAHRDRGPELLRSLVWAMNDESGTNGVFALGAVGEIGRRAPEMVEPFMGCLVPLAEDDGLRLELLRTFTKIAEVDPGVVAPFLDHLEREAGPDEKQELENLRLVVAGKGASRG